MKSKIYEYQKNFKHSSYKIFLILAVVSAAMFSSCEGPEGPQGAPGPEGPAGESEVFEIRNVNFTPDNQGFYGIIYDLDPAILNSDMILVFRRSGYTTGGLPIWESLPKTYYFNDGAELDVNYDFTLADISITLDYTSPTALTAEFLQNQLFRVVIIPGYLSNKNATTPAVDLSKYEEVINAYHIDDSNVKALRQKQ